MVGGAAGFRRKSSRGFVLALSGRFLVVHKLKLKLETVRATARLQTRNPGDERSGGGNVRKLYALRTYEQM